MRRIWILYLYKPVLFSHRVTCTHPTHSSQLHTICPIPCSLLNIIINVGIIVKNLEDHVNLIHFLKKRILFRRSLRRDIQLRKNLHMTQILFLVAKGLEIVYGRFSLLSLIQFSLNPKQRNYLTLERVISESFGQINSNHRWTMSKIGFWIHSNTHFRLF